MFQYNCVKKKKQQLHIQQISFSKLQHKHIILQNCTAPYN